MAISITNILTYGGWCGPLFSNRQPDLTVDVHLPCDQKAFAGLSQKPSLVQEEDLRAFLFAAVVSIAICPAAFADESVSGNWHANLGSGVTINMNVTPDGGWSSQTYQKSQVVRQMQGTYKQMPSENGTGTLVFTPTQASIKGGTVHTETDKYQLAEDGKQLKLTSNGDTMVFEKQSHQ